MKTLVFPVFSFLFFLSLFASTAAGQPSSLRHDSSRAPVPATIDRTKMLRLVNEVRSRGCQCGDTYYPAAPALKWNAQLEAAAYHHSSDMAKNKFFSHKAPDGSRGGARLDRAGYNWKTYGENIGQGYRTEREMLNGWLSSPGHCKNILNKTYTEMGVAKVGTLWTQEFGSQ